MSKILEWVLIAITAIGVVLLIALLVGFPTMWLWNWLMPTIFRLTKITFFQSVGLLILTGLFFNNKQNKQDYE